MKLAKITWRSRRDFTGNYKCEGCGNIESHSGYDDANFHQNVTPRWKCKKCGKSTLDLGLKAEEVQTKYRADQVV